MNTRKRRSSTIAKIRICAPVILALSISPSVNAGTIDELNLSVAKSNAILSSMNKKAKKALVNAAQDNTFEKYFTTRDDDHKHELKEKIDEISLNVRDSFHVEEMCLIDPNGAEISRIVGSKIAHDLSNEEASADFFAPSFAQRPRTVYQSPIYMSPDVHKWVVAYVTPVVAENQKRAILHYEHGLDVYHKLLDRAPGPVGSIKVVVTTEGLTIWDHSESINVHKVSGDEEPSVYFDVFEFAGKDIQEIVADIDNGVEIVGDSGQRFLGAYRQVNDWYILAIQESDNELVSQVAD